MKIPNIKITPNYFDCFVKKGAIPKQNMTTHLEKKPEKRSASGRTGIDVLVHGE
jgi:hypothetical protein